MSTLAIPILAQALTLSAGDRTEVRVRRDQGAEYFDVQSAAYLRLQMRSARVQWELQYAPAYTSYALGSAEHSTTIDNTGALRANLRLTQNTTLSFSETMSYGQQNLRLAQLSGPTSIAPASNGSTDPATPNGTTNSGSSRTQSPSTSQVSPIASSVNYASTSTSAAISHRLDRRTNVSGVLTYSLAQGIDATSRERIPRAETKLASIAATQNVTRTDNVLLAVAGQETKTRLEGVQLQSTLVAPLDTPDSGARSADLDAWIVTGTAGWNHLFSRHWTLTTSAVAAYTMSKGADGRRKIGVVPGGSLGFQYLNTLQGGRLNVASVESLAPTVDRYSGIVVSRLTSSLSASWTRRALTCGAVAGAATSLGSQEASQTLLGSASLAEFVAYQLSRHWRGEFGVREAWQEFRGVERSPVIWNAYLAVIYGTGFIAL